MQLKFSVDGVTQLNRNLRLFADSLNDLSKFYDEAIKLVDENVDGIFKSEGSSLEKNPTWKGLAPSTLRARAGRWGYYKNAPSNPGTLRWTGALEESRKKQSTSRFGSLEMTRPYAKYHQRGGGSLPKRAIIELNNRLNADIVRKLQETVEKEKGVYGLQA